MLNYKWIMPTTFTTERDHQMAIKLGISDFLATMLRRRGITNLQDAQQFLHPSLKQLSDDAHLDSKSQIHDMAKGTALIRKTIRKHEKITIYGDYDTDGITATSIMYTLLKHYGANVDPFIPNRFKDGYGPNLTEYKRIISNGTKLLITVDNGISGKKEVTYARKHGMNVIITDHHDFPRTKSGKLNLPPANAIIMGKYPGHRFHRAKDDDHTTDFCGAGIAFMIANYMLGHVPTDLLDLAALGTVADSVNLTKENRTIVKYGLQHIRFTQRAGIQALANVARIDLQHMTSTELSFSLIPRLNALGRMRDANVGVQLLTTTDISKAEQLAALTERCNRKRQTIMRKQIPQVIKQASTPANLKCNFLVLADKHWYPGIVGIMASHVIETFWKPTIVIGHLKYDDKRGIDRGSGRSIDGFNLFSAMNPIRTDMTSFGGHPMACGLSIKPDKIKKLRNDLEKRSSKVKELNPTITPDLELTPNQLTFHLLQQLQVLEPFGVGNEAPQICVRFDRIFNIKTMGNGKSLQFTLGPNPRSLRAVAFKMGKLCQTLKQRPTNLEMVGELNLNHFRGRTYLQFKVDHMRYITKTEIKREQDRQSKVMQQKHIRTQFGFLYYYLRYLKSQYGAIDLKSAIKKIINMSNLDQKFIKIGINVFIELKLLGKSDNKIKIVTPHKTNLGKSTTYKKYFGSN